MNISSGFPVRLGAVCVLTALSISHSLALPMQPGLQEMPLPPVQPAPPKITIDGKLDEWKGLTGYEYSPLGSLLKAGDDPAMGAILADPVSVEFKTCYDTDALYVAAEWHDRHPGTNRAAAGNAAQWAAGGEGFELSVHTDRTLHLACWPTSAGLTVMARYDDQPKWQDISGSVLAAGLTGADGKTATQELRIPWSVITATGKLPADGTLEMGVDFAWNAIPPSFVSNLRKAIAVNTDGAAPGICASFLTERPSLVSAGYIANQNDWGTLVFGGTSAGDQAVKASNGSTSFDTLAVPLAKSPPATDGSLDGWDPAAFQTANFMGSLWGSRFSCQMAAQYDADCLYLAAWFASPGPSNIKSEISQQGFRGGDALQVRMSNGTKKIALCGWYDNSTLQSALTADDKDLPSPFLLQQGAKEGFKSDGQGGYVQEIALPWKVLFGTAPKDGSQYKATFQLWYADLTNRFPLHVKTTLERRPALSVAYKMPVDGELTLGLFSRDGQLLRWLAQGDYRYAGENKEPWDGLDQYGNPVAPGSYTLKGLYHPPVTTDYLTSVCNPGNPPWPTPDDKGDWLGDEHHPQAAVTDGKWVYLAAPGSELGYSIIAVDETGQRQWAVRAGATGDRSVSLALSGDYLYALYSGGMLTDSTHTYNWKNGVGVAYLVCYDKRTGKPVQFTLKDPGLKVATWPYRDDFTWLDVLRNNKSFTPQVYGGQPRYYRTDVGEPTNALGMAVLGGKVYISMNFDNKLLVVDGATGKPTGEEIPVNSPVGLGPLDDHTLLAVSGKQVVKIDVTSKAVTPLITSGLVAPDNITTDKDGNIYVSDWATSFQVKVFDPAGKFLHAIGEEGGRPWVGKWDPNGMLVPRGVAVTDAGKLWVAEDDGSPKRISVWNAKTGAFLKDYIGPTPYGGGTWFWIDPTDRTLVHTEGTTFKVDYDKKTYTPLAIDYRRQNRDDPFTPIGHNLDVSQGRVLYHDGHEYVVHLGRSLQILERKGDVYKPVAAFGGIFAGFGNDGTEVIDWDSMGYHPYKNFFPDCFKGHVGDNYCWVDANGDNLVQPEEMQWIKPNKGDYKEGTQGSYGSGWGTDISPDWSYFGFCQFHDHTGLVRIDLKGWTKDGAPIYDLANIRILALLPPKHAVAAVHVTDDKKLIVSYSNEGMGLWNNATDALECYDLDGHHLWSIRQPARNAEKEVCASGAIYDFKLPKFGDVFGTWNYHGNQRPYLITTDGLYVSTMLELTQLGPTSLRGESAVYYYQAKDGTPYIINGANQAEHIFKINGLQGDTSGRFGGTYELSDQDAKLAASMREVPEQKIAPKPVLAVTWLKTPPLLDGSLTGWNMREGVSLDGGSGKSADIALGRDANNLYLAYKVHEPTPPMRNGGADWRSLFISGDCVDLMLQTDPKADPHRRSAVAGDERLLFTMFQDKPVAVLYRPVVPGASSPASLASAQIDQIIQLDSAKVAIKRDAEHGTYTVEAAVPLKDLGIDPKSKDDLRGDVGVIFSDESGKSRSLRLYYYNHDTQMIDDLATEATLQPEDWGTIAMPLGLNLVSNGGFEEPFVDSTEDADKGWYIYQEMDGNDAVMSEESPYSGHQSLLLETPEHIPFAPGAYENPDAKAFYNGENFGKGRASVIVSQKVPVTAGHQYDLRYRYRSENFLAETRPPRPAGHPRGFVALGARLEWVCTPPHKAPMGVNLIAWQSQSMQEWQTVYDFYNQPWTSPKVYVAPEGAVAANISFQMRTATADVLPKFFVDDVELVDVTPGS